MNDNIRIHVIPTPFYGANCCVITPQSQGDGQVGALVVDPSFGVREEIRRALEEDGAYVGAVLATHGHADHVWDCAEVASWAPKGTAPVWIPGPDAYRLDDPASYVSLPLPEEVSEGWRKPSVIKECPIDSFEYVPGLVLRMVPAPGHTEGSALFLGASLLTVYWNGVRALDTGVVVPWALSGDVIFAGSVGRTDMPGGDETQMRHTLRTLANVIDPQTILFPGHSVATTMGDELTNNAYLRRAKSIG